MKNIFGSICLIGILFFLGCSEPEKQEDIDLEEIKESRKGLDFGAQEEDLFGQLDTLLKEWQRAQRSKDHANIQASERQLKSLALGHFSTLVNALDSPDPEVEMVALTTLGFSEDLRAIPYLLQKFSSSNAQIRGNAAMGIGHIGSSQTPLEPLLKGLKEDPDGRVRGMIAFAIYRVIEEEEAELALPYLIEALKDPSPTVRNHALIVLGKIQEEEAAPAIIATTLNDKKISVVCNSIRTLSLLEAKEAIEPLIKKLRDPAPRIRQYSYHSLVKITGENFGPEPEKWEEWAK